MRDVLDGLFLASTVGAVRAALAGQKVPGASDVVVVGDERLARALANEGVGVVAVVEGESRIRRHRAAVVGQPHSIPLPDQGAAAVVGTGAVGADGIACVAEWSRLVRDGGTIVLVDRGAAAVASRRALAGGLSNIEQRTAGRVVVTSGSVNALVPDRPRGEPLA